MLNFDESHKSADLSSVKSKLEKAKTAGKILIAGVFISGCILFGNYIGNQAFPNNENGDVPVNFSAVVTESDQPVIVDLYYYTKKIDPNPFINSNKYTLVTPDGDRIVTNMDDVVVFEGENAREQAENYARSVYGEDAQIVYFESDGAPGLSRSL